MANQRIAVIGLGRMGAALAATVLARGYPAFVWNRTEAKADPLVRAGARKSGSPAEAIAAADVVIVCVGNYSDSEQVLSGCGDLSGKTVIQLTTGRAHEAEALRAWVEGKGGAYLDGSILAYPSQIGLPGTMLVVAGPRSAWAWCEQIIRHLGGASLYAGEDFAAPIAMGFALAIPSLMAMVGMLLGAHALERAGLDLKVYTEALPGITRSLTDGLGRQAEAMVANDFSATEASLAAWAAAFGDTWAAELNQSGPASLGEDIAAILRPIGELLNRGVAAGFGEEDLTAAIKLLRRTAARPAE